MPDQRMMLSMRSLVRALILLLAFGVVVPERCAGWESSAAARMDCCAKAKHDCRDQQAADACCAQNEQERQEQVAAAVILLGPPPLRVLDALPTLPDVVAIAVRSFELTQDSRPKRPPYLLTSVLLI
jgi:hypothetical protein